MRTVKECAVDIICREGDKLTNRQIAEKVCNLMKSNTTWKSIAWYKNKINRGIIKVEKEKCKWLNKCSFSPNELLVEDLDELIYENEAEHYVCEYEMKRKGKYPHKVNNSSGYDYDSDDRHIEVKGKKKKGATHISLTSNETEKLIKDPKYYLYLVEGDFDTEKKNIDLYIIPQQDLLSMSQLKIQARLTQLSNKEKRAKWIA